MIRLEFRQGTSSKFWEASAQGTALTVRWGRIGSAGQSKTRTFASADQAAAERDTLVREKLAKGYVRAEGPVAEVAASKPERLEAERKIQRFEFTHAKKKRLAWVETEGAQLTLGEGAPGTVPEERTETCASAAEAKRKRDALIGKWMAAGFELRIGQPAGATRPARKTIATSPLELAAIENPSDPKAWDALRKWRAAQDDLPGRATAAQLAGNDAEAAQLYSQLLESTLPDFSDELSNVIASPVWDAGLLTAVTFQLDAGWFETQLKKLVRPLLASPLARAVAELTLDQTESGGVWWGERTAFALELLGSAPCARRLRTLYLVAGADFEGDAGAARAIPSSALAKFSALETLSLRSQDGLAPGPELARLRHLRRSGVDLPLAELGRISNGEWEGLESLSFSFASSYPRELDEYEDEEELAELRAGMARFLEGRAFPKLRALSLSLDDGFAGEEAIRRRIIESPLGQRLTSIEVTVAEPAAGLDLLGP